MNGAKIILLFAAAFSADGLLCAQTNIWTNSVAAKWESSVYWSQGSPPNSSESVFIIQTNFPFGFTTVTIDATTSGSYPATMTVSNLTVLGSSVLSLTNAGSTTPLQVLNEFDLVGDGNLTEDNSALQVNGAMHLDGNGAAIQFTLNSGTASVSNLVVGGIGTGRGVMQQFGGVLTVYPGLLELGAGLTTWGTADIYGGTLIAPRGITVGSGGDPMLTISTLSITNGAVYVTNALHNAFVGINGGSSAVVLDGGLLQMDDLVLTNSGSFTYKSGTLLFTRPFQVEGGSSVSVLSGTLTTTNTFALAVSANSTGSVFVANGTLNVTNAAMGVGNDGTIPHGAGVGIVAVSNGTLNATLMNLGSTAGGSGSLTVESNGMVNIQSNFTVVSGSLSSTSAVAVASGTLSVTNGTVAIGSLGSGRMDVSGTVLARRLQLGGVPGSSAGAVYLLPGGLIISPSVSANYFLIGGGDLDSSGGDVTVGENHNSELDVNSGNGLASNLYVGYSPGYTGTYIQTGGTVSVTNSLIVGDCVNGAVGVLVVSGGVLYVTNATHTAFMDVRNGTVTLSAGGMIVVDTLYITNTCGNFLKRGGTLMMNNAPVLSPNMDADADGESNAAEFQAGTDPLDPNSVFAASAAVTNQNVVITWTTEGGHAYVVQNRTDLRTGSFHDLSPVITVSGNGAGTTNYTHVGGATNRTGFYRVRLGP